MNVPALLKFSLATWRLASLLTGEDGPFLVFRNLRELAGIRHDDDGQVMMVPETFPAGVLSCVWCCSIWVSLFWMALYLIAPKLAGKLAEIFALSTGAILVDRVAKG